MSKMSQLTHRLITDKIAGNTVSLQDACAEADLSPV